MKRYGLLDFDVPVSWHSTCVVIGDPLSDKPLLYVPKPVAWVIRAHRNFMIWYRGAQLRRRARQRQRTSQA